jgi:isopenicillin N synthase-like dioxygenase
MQNLTPITETKQNSPHENPIRQVPTLSLRDYTHGSLIQQGLFVQQLFHGMKDYGFIILKDHPVQQTLLSHAYDILQKFYALPTEKKLQYATVVGGQRGYTPFGKEHAKDSPVMDLKEFWHVGRDIEETNNPFYPPNIWPAEIPEFRAIFTELYDTLEETGNIMLEALTGPLEVPQDFFRTLTHNGNSILRLLHYPPIPEGIDPRCIRAAAHEDINFITLLPAATQSGLQLKDRDGKWLDIVSDPGSLIVDAGDMLARLTNDVIPSTTHQVINPQDGTNAARYSMPFFMHPHPQALLSCLDSCRGNGEKYPPIRSGDFLLQRLREIGLIK